MKNVNDKLVIISNLKSLPDELSFEELIKRKFYSKGKWLRN